MRRPPSAGLALGALALLAAGLSVSGRTHGAQAAAQAVAAQASGAQADTAQADAKQAGAAQANAPAPAAQGARPAAKPKLLLFVSVDQMRADYLTRFAGLFSGGLRRLLERGAVFPNAYYRHAHNETGPGHAVLLSGRDPRSSGIVGNDWYDSTLRRMINVVEDPVQQTLGGEGRAASPANFVGFTLGDFLKAAAPETRVVGVALKDRAAILMTGRRADGAYWFENAQGRFITSTFYAREAPSWLTSWNQRRVPDSYAGKAWTRLLPDKSTYERLAGPDSVAGERDGTAGVFPHAARFSPPNPLFYEELRRRPWGDEIVLDAALHAMEAHRLGRGPATDVLAVGFSATDSIGHSYGPDSQEIMDQVLRLDATLGKLFDAIDARVGRDAWLFGLSADHGAMPLPERLRQQGKQARRATPRELADAVGSSLAAHFPEATDLIASIDGPHFYIDLRALERRGLRRSAVEAAIAEGMLKTGFVEQVYTHSQLTGDSAADDPAFELHQRAFFAPRSPHVIARLKPYVYFSSNTTGTGHGTHHEYDRHVPLAFMGPGVAPGRYPAECGPEDIAPTLGALLGFEYPLQDAKRVLTEMFAK